MNARKFSTRTFCPRIARRAVLIPLLLVLVVLCCALTPFFLAGARQQPQQKPTAGNAETTAIVGATVVDGTGRAPFPATVLIRGERIVAVGSDVSVPAGVHVIHAEGQTLLPGLLDLHTHLPYATAPGITADWAKNLKAYLYCGVTTTVDFGTYPETFEPMRRLLRDGVIEGPRLVLAVRMSTPGGHGAEGGRGERFTLEVQTPRQARAAVQSVLPFHPDVIKVFTDGWRYNTAPDMTSMNVETLTALVDEAHKHGLKVLTHTVTLERAKIAARAGVDVLAHGVSDREVDAELIELMRAKKTALVSTLAVYEPRGRDILSPLLNTVLEPAVRARIQPALVAPPSRPPDDNERALVQQIPTEPSVTPNTNATETARTRADQAARAKRWRNLLHNVATLHAAGITLGAGTDAGVTGTHHGWATLRELELLVAGGLTPMQAITAATYDNARALNVENERGSIAAGKLADLLLVDGAPDRRIADIERVSRVFLGGREIDRQKLARDIASPEQTALPAVKVGQEVDDFEGSNDLGGMVTNMSATRSGNSSGKSNAASLAVEALPSSNTVKTTGDTLRSDLNTLWIDSSDDGLDHSRILMNRTLRKSSDHTLSILAHMSVAEHPYVRVSVPLTLGAVVPADVRAYHGVRFDVRGDGGAYRLVVPTRAVRDSNYFQTPFKAAGEWKTMRIDFASLTQEKTSKPATWTGADALMLTFEIARPPGTGGWLELDNVRFY